MGVGVGMNSRAEDGTNWAELAERRDGGQIVSPSLLLVHSKRHPSGGRSDLLERLRESWKSCLSGVIMLCTWNSRSHAV